MSDSGATESLRDELAQAIHHAITVVPGVMDFTEKSLVDAVVVLVEQRIAEARDQIDCTSKNWIDGWQTRDAEDGFIRQESRAEERERIAAKIEALPGYGQHGADASPDGWLVFRDAALRVVRGDE